MFRYKLWCVMLAVLLSACSEPLSPAPSVFLSTQSVEQMPFDVDASNQAAWWSPVDVWNGTTYFIYNRPGTNNGNHQVALAKRTGDGTWFERCLKETNGNCATYTDDLGHNQPSIAIDGDGIIHAFVSMHNDTWRYYRGTTSGYISNVVNRSSELPDQGKRFTYPNLVRTPNGDVYLIIRRNESGRRVGVLYRWNNSSDTWSRVAVFASEANAVVYPDDIQADPDGNLHIIWEWAKTQPQGLRHLGSYMVYKPSTGQFYNAAGQSVTVPVTTSSNVIYQPLEGSETFANHKGTAENQPALQSAKLAVYGNTNRPSIAYRYREVTGGKFTVRRARWNGSRWVRETIYAGAYDTYAAVDTTHDGNTVRVYYAKKSGGTNTAFVSEKSAGSTFVERPIATGQAIERLAVYMLPNGSDIHYLVDPTALSSSVGKIQFQELQR